MTVPGRNQPTVPTTTLRTIRSVAEGLPRDGEAPVSRAYGSPRKDFVSSNQVYTTMLHEIDSLSDSSALRRYGWILETQVKLFNEGPEFTGALFE